jgi:chromate transporter
MQQTPDRLSTSNPPTSETLISEKGIGLWRLTRYFLKLGTIGFGGPVALIGFMHRDLVEQRRWITEDTYKLSLALAQIMPGPLAAQTAIADILKPALRARPWSD